VPYAIRQNLQNCFDQIKVERVVLNALGLDAASPPDICAFGDLSAIAFRHGESSIGEVDPPRAQ
jgi:hypothetical protein